MEPKRSVLGLVFLTVFLDIVGFSVIFPLFPDLLDHYLALEGPESFLGKLITRLESFAGRDSNAVAALFGGLLGSIYGLLQFVFSTIWGSLSDRVGRRRVLLITLVGTVFSYILWVFAGSFLVLIAARILGGAMAGNIATASAAVADTTAPKDRAKGMGMVGMGIGLGFVIGPAIGAYFSTFEFGEAVPTSSFALNPFSGAALVSLVLAAINLVWVATRFPETLPAERRGEVQSTRTLNPFRRLGDLDFPGVARTNILYFLYVGAFSAIEFTLTFLVVERLAYTRMQLGGMFVFVGLVIAFVQGGLVRRLAPRLGERRLTLVGLLLTAPGFLAIGWAHSGAQLYIGLAFMAVGSAFVMPCLSALVSRYSPANVQGLAQGTFRSMASLSRAVGPILGALLYWRLGSESPYFIGSLFLILPLAMALGLPAPPSGEAPEASSIK